jgi:multiple sugar transport system ATP-binding protein
MARIRCENVTKRYGGVVAVDRLDLEIKDKEFMVFLGPSGCGKTTTLNIIAGLEEVSGGFVWFDDANVTGVPPHKREVAMVFQSYALYPQKTVYENVAFALRLRRVNQSEIDRRVRAAAEQLEIAHLLERRPHELSGGQRQRVALGRAIVRQPTVFLMDEPLSNLDAALRVSMRMLIKKLHQSMGTTFVYVTHDQAEAMTLADRITVMRNGVVQQLDTPDGIYSRPRNRFVAGFLGSPQMNFVEGELHQAQGALRFARGEVSLPVDSSRLDGAAGRGVVLGLRPEDVELANGRAADLEGRVVLVSPLGSEQHVNVAIGDSELVFRLGKEARVAPGDTLGLVVDPRRVHLFDPQSEASLSAGGS